MVGAGRYKLIEKVGKGMFGVVASAEEKGGKVVALKIIRKNEMMMVSGEREYRILSGLKKPEHIVGVLDYFHESGHLFLVMELMGADLRSYVRKNQDKVSLANLRSYAISMFMGLH
jgi:serine/threonine protein kinase